MPREHTAEAVHMATGRWLTIDDALEYVGHKVSHETIRRALHDGEIAGRNIGGRNGWLTTRKALDEWIERGNREPRREP
jgi:excisionase family DNA binding protein